MENVYSNYLIQYYNEIKQGKIIAGIELKIELQKLIEDLNNPKYKYDTKKAYIKISFMETLCLQNKKPFYNKPLKLMLWQKAFIEVVYSFKIFDKLQKNLKPSQHNTVQKN